MRARARCAFNIAAMNDPYQSLLDAAIHRLQDMKAAGARFVPVSMEALAALSQPTAPAKAPSPRLAVPTVTPSPTPMPRPVLRTPAPVAAPAPVVTPVSVAAPIAPGDKAAAFAALRARALACVRCPNLVAARKNVVFGVGDINATLMFVGEAPGADEDLQGEPFVGAAGQLLTRIIQTMGFSRETVYIGNILKCRPNMPPGAPGNRKPTPDEMNTCKPYLLEQIALIQPKVIVALGGTAVEGLLGLTGITKLRGNWQQFQGIPVMPTYHPSYLLRNQSLAEKRRVWEDMLAVMEKLGLPVSEKQRGYFLKA